MSQVMAKSGGYDEHVGTRPTNSEYVQTTLDNPKLSMMASTSHTTFKFNLAFKISTRPVYVRMSDDGDEELVYDSDMMREGKKYCVEWSGERCVLIKNHGKVDMYFFKP